MLTWEDIDPYHKRAAIPGGWLVKAYEDIYESFHEDSPVDRGYNWRITTCFVPDINHEWKP